MPPIKNYQVRGALERIERPVLDPSRGGRGYDLQIHAIVRKLHHDGLSATQIWLRHQDTPSPSRRTINRWVERQMDHGQIRRFCATGNSCAQVLHGTELLLLALFRQLVPNATAAEANRFLWNAHGRFQPVPRLYCRSQITRAGDRLALSHKRTSVEALQALLPCNRQKRWVYYNMAYPFGVADIPKEDMIDVDEAGIFLESCNCKYAKATIGSRAKISGAYGHSKKTTIIMAIAGNPEGDRWIELLQGGNCNVHNFLGSIELILDEIGDGAEGNRRTFTMDNLRVHHYPMVSQLILGRGHRLAFRAPYHSVDGLIEYFFNWLQNQLTIHSNRVNNFADLEQKIYAALPRMADFQNFFVRCGFN